ncbi:hypothetical protein NL676_013945 [Syzygium grande]|nr:hypothetical protein NL676_013945 [Syzygium grande]
MPGPIDALPSAFLRSSDSGKGAAPTCVMLPSRTGENRAARATGGRRKEEGRAEPGPVAQERRRKKRKAG